MAQPRAILQMLYNARRLIGGVAFLLTLAACEAGPPPEVALRPGIGQAADLDAIRPPSGRSYRYAVEMDGDMLPAELRLRAQRRSATRMDYRGTLNLTLPEADNLQAIGEELAQVFELDTLGFQIRGNTILIPVEMRTDNRFRALSSTLIALEGTYSPHDCFAVIGTCRYIVASGERSAAMIAETEENGGVWKTTLRPDPRKRRSGPRIGVTTEYYTIDRNAVPIDIVITDRERGRRSVTVFRRK